jgi:hypothetical protein
MADPRRPRPLAVVGKTLGVAAAAGAAQAVSQTLPAVLPPAIGGPVAVALAAVIGYLLPQPHRPRER